MEVTTGTGIFVFAIVFPFSVMAAALGIIGLVVTIAIIASCKCRIYHSYM